MMGVNKKLSITAFSLATALTGSALFALMAMIAVFGPGDEMVRLLSTLFIGYEASAPGLFLGLVWGFLAGGLAGLFCAWIYNKML